VAGARAQAPLLEISVVESPPVAGAALLAVDAPWHGRRGRAAHPRRI
jgi:hypothetical protein